MSAKAARRLFFIGLLFMTLTQIAFLAKTGNGLSNFNNFDEADGIRSGEAFAKDGLTSHHGLARLLYGNRFPGNGAVIDHLEPDGKVKAEFLIGYPERLWDKNQWVYLHYPPGAPLMSGVYATIFGPERVMLWRLVPMTLGFLAMIIFYCALVHAFGADRGALIAFACILLPMTHTYLSGLSYLTYVYVLTLLQLSVLIRWLWGGGRKGWHLPALFILGFIQGWFSFDLFFVVSFSIIPLWLMRRAENPVVPVRELLLGIGFPFVAFGFAHFLHLLQVAAELDSLQAAIAELTRTAGNRSGTDVSYIKTLIKALYLYVREFMRLYNQHSGPFLLVAVALGGITAAFRNTRLELVPVWRKNPVVISLSWPGSKPLWPALVSAFIICLMWVIAMPYGNIGNFHIYPRIFFFFYFVLVLAVIQSLNINTVEKPKATDQLA